MYTPRQNGRLLLICAASVAALACGGSPDSEPGGAEGGGQAGTAGSVNRGGSVTAAGSVATGGSSASGAAGSTATGGGSDAEQAGTAGASGAGVGGSGPGGPCDLSGVPNAAVSKWASPNADGTLSYAKLPDGSHIPDYSNAGYMGGGVAFPNPPIASSIAPSGGDDTGAIQKALDAAGSRPINDGLRGVVLLAAGTYNVSSTLGIHASGVVLRGSGSGSGGTVIRVGGAPHTAIVISGSGDRSRTGAAITINDAYVAAGSRSFHVESASAFKVGDTVLVQRPVTSKWLELMGMDNMVRNGKRQTWLGVGSVTESDRVITGIAGNEVTLDAPLTDSLDQQYLSPPGPKLIRYTFNGRIERVGVEGLRLVAPKQTAGNASPQFTAVQLDAVQSGFVRDVVTEEFGFGMSLGDKSKWITVQDSAVLRTTPVDNSAGYPFQFSVLHAPQRSGRPVATPGRRFDVHVHALGRDERALRRQSRCQLQPGPEVQRWWANGQHQPAEAEARRGRGNDDVVPGILT